jgi:hypothetical protein
MAGENTNIQFYVNEEIHISTSDGDREVTLGTSTGSRQGLGIKYDINTTPLDFSITPSGIIWTNGVTTYTSSLSRIAAVGQAFAAVEIPPNVTTLKINNTILLDNGSGNTLSLSNNNIKYPTSYQTASASISNTSNSVQTFNGSTLTATLPVVSSTNVGTQFLITNTNAGNLTVASSSSQLIYYSVGTAAATTRILNTGHSHIFTAIQTTGATTYGWSMV